MLGTCTRTNHQKFALVDAIIFYYNKMSDKNSPSRERVIIHELGTLEDHESLMDFPSGNFLLQAMLPTYIELLPSTDPVYWQTAARNALLVECGILSQETSGSDRESNDEEASVVRTAWERLCEVASKGNVEEDANNDLIEFIRAGGKSNRRRLQWALMDCAPGCQFNLHAHPNLELVYCIKGQLHEIRLDNDHNVITKSFEVIEDDTNQNPKVKGPSLIGCQRSWRFGTLGQGKWLVNRVGTIHKSFTATNGEGCVLLTLWGGSHANIPEELPVVTNAVQSMDLKLKTHSAGCCATSEGIEFISETFLPDSEKSTNNSYR